MSAPAITLTSDFGLRDGFAAAMRAAILGILPDASIVDISHDVPPQDVAQGAFIVGTTCPRFPEGTVHVAVVDPGVGTDRRPVLLTAGGHVYVAPDNGLLTYILAAHGAVGDLQQLGREGGFGTPARLPVPRACSAYLLNRDAYWLAPVSPTFHGRDIFAPVAAHIASGVRPDDSGEPVDTLTYLNLLHPLREAGAIHGRVIYVDGFGNLATNLVAREMETKVVVEIAGERISGLSDSYTAGGGLLAIAGSHGYLEIALTNGSAARRLGAAVGTGVTVTTVG